MKFSIERGGGGGATQASAFFIRGNISRWMLLFGSQIYGNKKMEENQAT